MASVDYVAVPAASPYVPFDDLHLGRSYQHVVSRLLRFWDARNMKKDRDFMGIVLLLLDEKIAFKDSDTGKASNRCRLLSGFGVGALEALAIVTLFEIGAFASGPIVLAKSRSGGS